MHFNHANIINLAERPFKDINHMNESLIKNWNSRVKPDDYVFHIGDFCYKSSASGDYKKFVDRLNGKIIFIWGNHDKNNGIRTPILDVKIQYGGVPLLLTHRPEDVGYFGGYLALCGHVHGLWKFQNVDFFENSCDVCNVGVDVWNYHPILINEITTEYEQWRKLQPKRPKK